MSDNEPARVLDLLDLPGDPRGALLLDVLAPERAVRACLAEDGFDDVPRNGAAVLTGWYPSATAVREALGTTKQAASQLIDTLVLRGYLERRPHPSDRRRTGLVLTGRGHAAADSLRRGVGDVDHELGHSVTPVDRVPVRRTLGVIADLGRQSDIESAAAAGPSPARLSRTSAIFPVADVARALAHYESLGFAVEPYPDGGYGFAPRDNVGIHLNHVPDVDPAANLTAVYLYVTDPDALAQEWSAPEIGGRTIPPVDTAYAMREGAPVDPDGNLIRFGSNSG